MANKLGQFHKLGKQNRNQPDLTNNILTVPASILFCRNKYDKEFDMKHKYPPPKIIGTKSTVYWHLGNIQGQARCHQTINNYP